MVQLSSKNEYLIVAVYGDMDHHSADEIKTRVDREYRTQNYKNIVFDLENVEFMDSAGIGVIVGRYKNVAPAGGKVFAVNISEGIDRILELSGMKKIITCEETLEAAVSASLGRGGING